MNLYIRLASLILPRSGRVTASKGETLRTLSVRKAEVALGKFNLVPRASIPTFKTFADRYEELVSIHKKGHTGKHYIIQMLVRIFGNRRISDITAEDGERFKAVRSGQVKPATVATRLVQAGVDIITVQHLLGHARISMTARYAHSPDTS